MTRPDDDEAGSDEEEWRFSVDDVSADPEDDDEEGSVFGPRPDEGAREVVPGDPDLENALFVALGVLASLVLVAAVVGLV